MARTKSIRLQKSKKEIAKLLKFSKRLSRIIAKTISAIDTDEQNAIAVAASQKAKQKKESKIGRKAKRGRKPGRKGKRGRPAGTGKGKKSPGGKKAGKANGKRGGKRGRNPWTPADIRKLIELISKGVKVNEVAARMKRKPSAVRQRMSQEGISIRSLKKSGGKAASAPARRGRKAGRPAARPEASEKVAPKADPAKDAFFVDPAKAKKA